MSPDQQLKLDALAFIASINDNQFVLNDGELNVKSIAVASVDGLEDLLNAKASTASVATLRTSLLNLADELNAYKTTTDTKLEELDERLTWQNLF
jgi:hypothetical protein